jgi:tRNA (Thr-GGU) A37 N-methylase
MQQINFLLPGQREKDVNRPLVTFEIDHELAIQPYRRIGGLKGINLCGHLVVIWWSSDLGP